MKKRGTKKILFIHQSFPGQFLHVAKKLAEEGHQVLALALTPQQEIEGVKTVVYPLVRGPLEGLPFLLKEQDAKILRGESAASAMLSLKDQGFNPDIVYAHPGWGEALFVKTIWPDTKLIIYAEWFYNDNGQEVNFDPEFISLSEKELMRLRLKNTVFLHALNDADLAISPTKWQKSRFPLWAQEKIHVIHDGIDIEMINSVKPKKVYLPDRGITIQYGDPIITFATRYLEPVRGFHVFMRAIPKILKERPDVRIFIMGNDAGVNNKGYGGNNPKGETWRETFLKEIKKKSILERIHFLGFIPYRAYLSILKLSACHVYLTVPFILSWSFLEAATIGIPIVASDTPPVKEFSSRIKGLNLVNFFDKNAIAEKVLEIIENPVERTPNYLSEIDIKNTVPKIISALFGQEKKRGRKKK